MRGDGAGLQADRELLAEHEVIRRAFDKVVTTGAAVVIVATVLLPWAWAEAKRARRDQQPQPPYAAGA